MALFHLVVGAISISLSSEWCEPSTSHVEDSEACQRYFDFTVSKCFVILVNIIVNSIRALTFSKIASSSLVDVPVCVHYCWCIDFLNIISLVYVDVTL